MSNTVRLAIAGILAGMLSVAPAAAGTVSFSLNLGGTVQGVSDGMGGLIFTPANFTGTMPPFGPCQGLLSESANTITFTLANGTTITATTTMAGGTITGGTGIFTGATGSFQSTLMAVSGAPAGFLKYSLTGSGTIDAPGATGGVTVLPSSLQLQSPQGSSAALSNTVIVSNQGLATASFTASAAVTSKSDWLSISVPSGSVPAGSSSSFQVTANPSGLALGLYEGQVDVNVGGVSALTHVQLIVGNKGGNLQLSETGESFTAAVEGPMPAAQTLYVSNTGVGDLSGLTATTSVTGSETNWLHATITPGFASLTQTPVTVTVDPGSLPAGMYSGLVTFDLPSAVNSPQSVSVQMQVNPAPPPTFNPAGIFFTSTYDANTGNISIPPPQTVYITNPGSKTLSFTVNLATYGMVHTVIPTMGALFQFSPASGEVGPGSGQTTSMQVSVNATCITSYCPSTHSTGDAVLIAVNFPEIDYTYYMEVGYGQNEINTPACSPAGCNPGAPLLRAASGSGAATGRAVSEKASATSCTPAQLQGGFTSIPFAFQATVGQPAPLEAQIFDNCGNALDSGAVVATFSTGDAAVVLNPQGAGQWAATWTPQNAAANATINLQAGSPSGLFGLLTLPGSVAASTATPIIAAGGITNAASGAPVIAPGAFISIYGANMAGGLTVASSTPFPDSLGKTEAFLGGQSLPLYFTSTKQINAIVPYDIAPNSSQQLIIQSGDALSQPEPVTVAAAQPGVFTQNQSGSGPGAILGQKPGKVAALNTAANPASAGDALLIFCTGLGTVTPAVAAGSAASTTVLSNTDNPVTVTVGDKDAQVLFAGLAPGFVGLYQVNVLVPTGIAAADDVPVVLTEAGATSAPVTVAIK
jgi:uncharacterized protein (TIGR03437 family)